MVAHTPLDTSNFEATWHQLPWPVSRSANGDHIGPTGCHAPARAELATRLRQALRPVPPELKRILRAIRLRQEVVLDNVSDEPLEGARQMLEELGGQVIVTSLEAAHLTGHSRERLFRRLNPVTKPLRQTHPTFKTLMRRGLRLTPVRPWGCSD